jgi:TIR domain
MDGQSLKRQVFISHASDDPEWPEAELYKLANDLIAKGLEVCLDLRHEATQKLMSEIDWSQWMELSLPPSRNIFCLWSDLYAKAWKRDPTLPRGRGLAYEIAWIQAWLNGQKQHNNGRIIVLLKSRDAIDTMPVVFRSVVHVCDYSDADRMRRLSEKIEEEISSEFDPSEKTGVSGAESPGKPALMLTKDDLVRVDEVLIRHQASAAALKLRLADGYWRAIVDSIRMSGVVSEESLASPRDFLQEVVSLVRESRANDSLSEGKSRFTELMLEIRRPFSKNIEGWAKDDDAMRAGADAAVALSLLCACLMIQCGSEDLVVGLPKIQERGAAALLAGMVSVSIAGGSLELRSSSQGEVPLASGTRLMRIVGNDIKRDFERQLYATLPGNNSRSIQEGLKTGDLTDSQRDELRVFLENERDSGVYTRAMCFVVYLDVQPTASDFAIAKLLGIPVFHGHCEPVHKVVGVSEDYLVHRINSIWQDICKAIGEE